MMKKIYFLYFMLLSCMCFWACTEHEEVLAESISLSAEVNDVKLTSRTSDYAAPVSGEELDALVWLSLESGKYPESLPNDASEEWKELAQETNIPAHRKIHYRSGQASFPDATTESDRPRYPTNGETNVYCIGLYPYKENEGWEALPGDTTAVHAITGYDDLMFAPEISGNWNAHFGKQKFRHLLTWLKVCVCATTTEAGSNWGKLKKITLKNVPDSVTISFRVPEPPEPTEPKPKYPLHGIMSPSQKKSDVDILDNIDGIDLGIVVQDAASIFCYPQDEYYLSIVCGENNVTKDIKIDLSSLSTTGYDSRAGLQYVLTLYFSPFNVVEGVCTLKEWNAQNEDLYPTTN